VTSASRTSTTADIRLRVINAGMFIEEQIGLFDRLYITAGARFDGNSAFGDDFGIQMYPKLNASYIISDHDFWPLEWAEPVQLRAAVGDAGRAPGAFDAVQTWNPISGDDGSPAFTPGQLGNPDLGPERSREYEVGMDATFLQGRLGVDVSYFHQTTRDALIGMAPPASLGFLSSQLENVGVIESTGVELELTGVFLQSDQLDWRGRFHLATSNSEAVDVAGQEIILGSGRWNNFIREGYPVPSLFGTRVVNAGEMAEPVLEEDQFIGTVYPTRTLGMGTTLTALNGQVTLDVHGEFQGGHYLQNAVGFQNALRNVWVPCYEAQQAAAAGDPSALNSIPAEDRYKCLSPDEPYSYPGWLESADFFKLRSASLNLQLPERWIPGAETARLTLSGRNLLTITDYTGLDPEVTDFGFSVQRQEYYNIPPTRRFLASLRVTF
jgi:TonB-dependent starch-binding outer membrane protein SusC